MRLLGVICHHHHVGCKGYDQDDNDDHDVDSGTVEGALGLGDDVVTGDVSVIVIAQIVDVIEDFEERRFLPKHPHSTSQKCDTESLESNS